MQLINIFFFLALLLAFQANAIKTQNRLGNFFDTLWKTRPSFGTPPPASLSPSQSPGHQQLTQNQGQGSVSAPSAPGSQFASLVGVPVSIISRQSGYFLDVQVTGQLPTAAEIQYLLNNPLVQQALNGTNIQKQLNATNIQELGNELRQFLNGTPLNQLPGLQALLNGTDVNQLLSQLQQQLNVYQLLNGYINSTQLIVRQQSCSTSQKWRIIADVNGSYHIASSVVSGVSITINPLAVQNGQVADGTRIELLVDAALPSQRFTFEQSSGNFWRIVSSQLSGKSGSQTKKLVLDLQAGNLTQGTPVVASHDKTSDSNANLAEQDWLIVRRECGQSTSTSSSTPPDQGAGQSVPPTGGFSAPTSVSSPTDSPYVSSPQTVYVGQQSPVVYSSPVVEYSSPQAPSESPYQASSPVAEVSSPTYGGYGQESSDSGYQSPSAAGDQQSSSAYSSSGYQAPSSTGALYSSNGYSETPYQASSPVASGGYGQESSDSGISSSVYQQSSSALYSSSGYQSPSAAGYQSSTGGAEESSCASDVSSSDYQYPSSTGSPSTGNDQLSSAAQYSSVSSGSESGSESSAWNTYSAPNYVGAASSPIVIVESPPTNGQGSESSPVEAAYSSPATYVGAVSSPIVIVESPPTGEGSESSSVAAYSSPLVESSSDSSSDVYSSPADSYSSPAYSTPTYVGQQSPPVVVYSSPAADDSSSGASSSGASYSSSGASTGAGGGVAPSTGNYAAYPGYVPQ